MSTATVTSKGQITIPKSVRQSLHLHTGDRVLFEVHGEKEAVLKPVTRSVDEVYGKLHKASRSAQTVEEMDRAVSQRMSRKKA